MAEQSNQPIFRNRIINKGQLTRLISWAFTNYGTARTAQMADMIKDLGFRYATKAGVSISVDDLQIPPVSESCLRLPRKPFVRQKNVTAGEKLPRLNDSKSNRHLERNQ